MRHGHRPLVNGPTRMSQIDTDSTRADRLAVHEQVRLRQHLTELLEAAPFDGSAIEIRSGAPTEVTE